MYLPRQFAYPEHAEAVVRAHPLASLITHDPQGSSRACHVPMSLAVSDDGSWTLHAHVAKNNPQADDLHRADAQVLVLFVGPHAYMSPAVYDSEQHVPTWSYVAVHCRARAHVLQGEAAKDALLKTLIGEHEPAYAAQWRSLPKDYTERMLAGVVAFELRVHDVQCAVKLNQHRPQAHRAMHQRYANGNANERALAAWMERLALLDAPHASDPT